MKKAIISITTICFIFGVVLGIYYYKNSIKEKSDITYKSNINYEDTITTKKNTDSNINTIVTNSNREKIGPATKIIKKTYYKNCNHIIEETDKATQEIINLTEEEFRNINTEWEIQRFTSKEIVLYKEIEDFCNEHYILKDENGYITIYKTDMLGNEILYSSTDIWTGYLSEEDLKNIQNGLKVCTTKELNKLIEDFE